MALQPIPWQRRYKRKIFATDVGIILATVFTAQYLRFGAGEQGLEVSPYESTRFDIGYTALSATLVFGWLLTLSIFATRDHRVIGIGVDEYKRVVTATFATFGVLAILAYLLRSQVGRGYVLIALPVGLFLLLLGRWLWRRRLHHQRLLDKNVHRTLVVGDPSKCAHVVKEISRNRVSGFSLLGAITDTQDSHEVLLGIPVLGTFSTLLKNIDDHHIDTVIMTSADSISPETLRFLGWELESRGIELVVAAALTDVAGPRIHTRPVAGLPLIHVDYPTFTGSKRFVKRASDIIASSILIILLAPVLLIVAIAVKVSSKGPIFYSQERIGRSGVSFPMFKFRSMVQNADDQLQSLLDSQGTSYRPLHKIENDPRITPIGRFIRRYSLDELPQLLNVLFGNMSMVGPRPQREAEVALYGQHDHRRLLVKPGITGLWQVSGRSSLDWDDAIRLDLYYVENWSMTGDLVLAWKTVRAVVTADGAY